MSKKLSPKNKTPSTNAVIAASAVIANNTQIGNFTIVGERVRLGKGCRVGNNVVIHDDTVIGDNVRIDDGAVIGKLPMAAANTALTQVRTLKPAKIGSHCIIGTHAVIYRGCTLAQKVMVADLATVREQVVVGPSTIIGRGVAIECDCQIGSYCKFETNAYITAFSSVGNRCFVAPGVNTSNDTQLGRGLPANRHYQGVTIKTGGRIGVGATILPGRLIEADSVVAAGALLTTTAKSKKIYAGVPANYFRDVPKPQLLANWEPAAKSKKSHKS